MRRILFAAALLLLGSGAQAQSPPLGLPGQGNSGYPPGATPVATSGTGTTAGINIALPAAANQFTYACGVSVGAGTATAAITVTETVTNVVGGTMNLPPLNAPVTAATATGGPSNTITFTPCLRTSTVNESANLNISALGAGGVSQTAMIWGYQR